jgi:hypothetical protein
MSVNTTLSGLSQTAASNGPDGTTDAPSALDDAIRNALSFIAQLRDGKGHSAESDVASAATCDIGAANSHFVRITGTTGISSLGTNYNGPRFIRFAGALTLTHNASTLILPGGANITTAAGDTCIAVPIGSTPSGWAVGNFTRATGPAAFSATASAATSLTSATNVKVTFGTEVYDYGGYYDAATSRWTPPAGIHRIGASVRLASTTTTMFMYVYKNGSQHKEIGTSAQSATQQSSGWVEVEANGTDYFELWVQQAAATQNNSTSAVSTWFQGSQVR